MCQRTKRLLIALGGILLILIIAIVGFAWYLIDSFDKAPNAGQYPHKPDTELIRNFFDHRAEFEQLRSMLERDEHIFRIDDNWTDPPDLPSEKIAEYRQLFAVIGTPRGFYNLRNPLRIELLSSSQGWVTSGSAKGYVYLRERPNEGIVASLDEFHNGSDQVWKSALRHIEGNWYLFFDR